MYLFIYLFLHHCFLVHLNDIERLKSEFMALRMIVAPLILLARSQHNIALLIDVLKL